MQIEFKFHMEIYLLESLDNFMINTIILSLTLIQMLLKISQQYYQVMIWFQLIV